ncbi:Serine--glyoxylate aminotransferase [Porphyridium purpureum]|uniref:alanine--glyoxylate transaminase n=1 Tax=Porphyridium purpureum TaxID=35688 RepID=A0A5J4YPQ1_PORPP|nr:Serine--glyoxylate aminotransferase [Porphyridium purpureum]|eukprot:POR9642..scf222_8
MRLREKMAVPHGRNFLMVPGPSHVPDRILRAMHRQSVDHRSLDFPKITHSVLKDLKEFFQTKEGTCFVFPATGTGAWESCLSNTLNQGDKIISVRMGQFSHLWIDMMHRFGLDVLELDVEWGDGLPYDQIAALLRNDTRHEIKAVAVVQNETTTGVYTNIPKVRQLLNQLNHPALLFVDGVSSIGSLEFKMDEWQVDVAVTGSQKGLSLPAGLGLVCARPKALALGMDKPKSSNLPSVFFSWKDMVDQNQLGYFPYTPSVPLLWGLREALDMFVVEEGIQNVWARHHRFAEGVRRAVAAWGLRPIANKPEEYSDTVTTVLCPEGIDAQKIVATAYQKYNLSLGGGLMKLRGRVFRIGTLGDINELIILGTLAGTEMAMRDVGMPIKLGSGVAAAAEYFQQTAIPTRGLSGTQAKI